MTLLFNDLIAHPHIVNWIKTAPIQTTLWIVKPFTRSLKFVKSQSELVGNLSSAAACAWDAFLLLMRKTSGRKNFSGAWKPAEAWMGKSGSHSVDCVGFLKWRKNKKEGNRERRKTRSWSASFSCRRCGKQSLFYFNSTGKIRTSRDARVPRLFLPSTWRCNLMVDRFTKCKVIDEPQNGNLDCSTGLQEFHDSR